MAWWSRRWAMTNFLERGARNVVCWWKTGYVCPPAAPIYDPAEDQFSDDDEISPEGNSGSSYGADVLAESHPQPAPIAEPHPAQAVISHPHAPARSGPAPAPARMQHGIHTELELQRLHQEYAPKPKPGTPAPARQPAGSKNPIFNSLIKKLRR
jgi:hypothetical protein